MKRLLIITTNFPPSKSVGTHRILRICKYLDPRKWKISVLTLREKYYPEYRRGEPQPLPDFARKFSLYRTGKIDLVFYLLNLRTKLRGIKQLPHRGEQRPASPTAASNGQIASSAKIAASRKPKRKNRWQLFKDFWTDLFQFPDKHITWLPLAVWRGYRLIKKERIEVIFSSSPPHSLHLIAAILKVLTGVKLVIDFRDPWARSPWHDRERAANWFERWKHQRIINLERWVIEKADEVTLITREMRDDFARNYPDLPDRKFRLFNNGFDPENLQFTLNGKFPPKVDQQKVTFIHAGSLYKERDPTPILHAVKNLLDTGRLDSQRVEFLFLGAVTSHQVHTKALARRLGLEGVVKFVSRVSYQESLRYMAESEVLILLQPVTKLQLPGKFYDYICWDKPILAVAEENSATQNAVEDHFGIFVNVNDIADIEKGILFLYQHPHYKVEQIRRHRDTFDMSKAIKVFDDIITV